MELAMHDQVLNASLRFPCFTPAFLHVDHVAAPTAAGSGVKARRTNLNHITNLGEEQRL